MRGRKEPPWGVGLRLRAVRHRVRGHSHRREKGVAMSRLTRPLIVLLSTALIALVGFITGNVASAQPPGAPVSQKTVAVTGTDLDTGQQVFTGTFTANSAQADESAPK